MKTDPTLAKELSLIRRKHDDLIIINNPNINQYIHKKPNQPGLYPHYISLNATNAAPFISANYLDCNVSISNNIFAHKQPILNNYNNLTLQQLRQQCKNFKLKIHGNKHELVLRLHQRNNINNYHNKAHIWTTKTYNKKDTFPSNINIINYPMFHSNIATHSKTGSIIGTLHTYLTTNSHHAFNYINASSNFLSKLITNNKYPKHTIRKTLFRFASSRRFPYRKHPQAILHEILNKLPP